MPTVIILFDSHGGHTRTAAEALAAGAGLVPNVTVALMSAADSSKIFDLRCEVREKVLAFLQQNHPGSLPRVRADLGGLGPGAAGRLVE